MPTPSIIKKQNSNAADMTHPKLKQIQDGFTLKRNMIFESIQKLEEVQKDITRMHRTYPASTERRCVTDAELLKELGLIYTHLQAAGQSLCKYNTHLTYLSMESRQSKTEIRVQEIESKRSKPNPESEVVESLIDMSKE